MRATERFGKNKDRAATLEGCCWLRAAGQEHIWQVMSGLWQASSKSVWFSRDP